MVYEQHSQPGTNSGHRAACAVEFLAIWPEIGLQPFGEEDLWETRTVSALDGNLREILPRSSQSLP